MNGDRAAYALLPLPFSDHRLPALRPSALRRLPLQFAHLALQPVLPVGRVFVVFGRVGFVRRGVAFRRLAHAAHRGPVVGP